MNSDEARHWIENNKQWLIRIINGTEEITDVSHPFRLSWDSWKNLLGTCSYEDIARSKQIRNLFDKHKIEFRPPGLHDVIKMMNSCDGIVPKIPDPEDESMETQWHLTNIPKIAHFYWGNHVMSFMRWMCLYSFKMKNPDWNVRLYTPPKPSVFGTGSDKDPWCRSVETSNMFTGVNYLDKVKGIGVNVIPFDIKSLGFQDNIPEVHKSDILRWHLLDKYGGIWSDMDILFFRPMTCLDFNTSKYVNHLGHIYLEDRQHKIGFLLSQPNNPFYKKVLSECKHNYNRNICQVVGSDMLDKMYPTIESVNESSGGLFTSIGDDPVYWLKHQAVFYTFYANGINFMRRGSVGLHWYGGAHDARPLINGINHKNYIHCSNKCTIVELLKRYYKDGILV